MFVKLMDQPKTPAMNAKSAILSSQTFGFSIMRSGESVTSEKVREKSGMFHFNAFS